MTSPAAAAQAIADLHRDPDSVSIEGREGRMIVARWHLAEGPEGIECATLRVMHFGRPNYQFYATLNRTTVGAGHGFRTESEWPLGALRLPLGERGSVKRYSEKALRQHLPVALAAIRNNPDIRQRVGEFFAPDVPARTH